MELVIKPYHGLPCELEIFTINGKNADSGDIFDHKDKCEHYRKVVVCPYSKMKK